MVTIVLNVAWLIMLGIVAGVIVSPTGQFFAKTYLLSMLLSSVVGLMIGARWWLTWLVGTQLWTLGMLALCMWSLVACAAT